MPRAYSIKNYAASTDCELPVSPGAHLAIDWFQHQASITDLSRVYGSLAGQQKQFDSFQLEFNNERSHEALNQKTPWSCYECSPRSYLDEPGDPEYPSFWELRRVRNKGYVKFGGAEHFISEALVGKLVGLTEMEDGLWKLHFASHPLGEIGLKDGILRAYGGRGAGVSGRKRYA